MVAKAARDLGIVEQAVRSYVKSRADGQALDVDTRTRNALSAARAA